MARIEGLIENRIEINPKVGLELGFRAEREGGGRRGDDGEAAAEVP